MEQIAQQMAQAVTAIVQQNQQFAQTLDALRQQTTQQSKAITTLQERASVGSGSLVDTRGVGKPENLTSTKANDHATYITWRLKFLNWIQSSYLNSASRAPTQTRPTSWNRWKRQATKNTPRSDSRQTSVDENAWRSYLPKSRPFLFLFVRRNL
eukprot:2222204-Amphidinium_carterae.1